MKSRQLDNTRGLRPLPPVKQCRHVGPTGRCAGAANSTGYCPNHARAMKGATHE